MGIVQVAAGRKKRMFLWGQAVISAGGFGFASSLSFDILKLGRHHQSCRHSSVSPLCCYLLHTTLLHPSNGLVLPSFDRPDNHALWSFGGS